MLVSNLQEDKKKEAFRTPEVNLIMCLIASKTGGFLKKKGPNSFF